MTEKITHQNLILQPQDNERLANLCGLLDENLRQIESYMNVQISNRGNKFIIKGHEDIVPQTSDLIEKLYDISREEELTSKQLHMYMNKNSDSMSKSGHEIPDDEVTIKCRKLTIRPKSKSQEEYLGAILNNDLTFGIGSAGTGKTYLAVAAGVHALLNDKVQKIILIRPAVEAGEKLGFLPGDLAQKVDPYLKPLYDALYEMLGSERVQKLIEKEIIEVAPLAYLRGRTLNNAFIIMDESQNTTIDQMKMFLTRMGYGSYAVVNGDLTQIDLPRNVSSGLSNVLEVLAKTENIGVIRFSSIDVVRHPLVRKIIDAYEAFKGSNN